jgi:hypothetical protein
MLSALVEASLLEKVKINLCEFTSPESIVANPAKLPTKSQTYPVAAAAVAVPAGRFGAE